jgi:cytidine deaminase
MEFEVDIRKLIGEALKVLPNSYAPYSNVHVAVAILTSNGKIFLGVNVENASYGLTICAERVAVASAITHGEKNFDAVAIVSDTLEPLPPCGACRQVLAEFADSNLLIVSYSIKSGKTIKWRLGELLPYAFNSNYIKY